MKSKRPFNPAAGIARNCWIWALAGAALFIYPFIFSSSVYGLDYAIMFFAVIVFFTAIISGIIFWRMAQEFEKLFYSKEMLAHWTYGTEEWSRYTEEEHLRDRKEKMQLFLLVAIIAGIAGLISLVFVREAGVFIFLVMVGLIGLIFLVAQYAIASTYRRNRKYPGEVFIGMAGALLNRELHYWKLPASNLESAEYIEGDEPLIEIVYTAASGRGRGTYSARIPIPRGKEKEGQQVVAALTGSSDPDEKL